VAGNTVTRRLTDHEAALYNEWVANNRQVRKLIARMREVGDRATELIIATDTEPAN
jgi:hypothetical protein